MANYILNPLPKAEQTEVRQKRQYRKAPVVDYEVAVHAYKSKISELNRLVTETLNDLSKPLNARVNRLQYASCLCQELNLAIKDLRA